MTHQQSLHWKRLAVAGSPYLWGFGRTELELAAAASVGRRSVGWSGTLGNGNCLLNGIVQLLMYEQQRRLLGEAEQVAACAVLRQYICSRLLEAQPGSSLRQYFASNWQELTQGAVWQAMHNKARERAEERARAREQAGGEAGEAAGEEEGERVQLFCEVYAEPQARIWHGPALIRLVAMSLQRPITIFALQDILVSQSSPTKQDAVIEVASDKEEEEAAQALPVRPTRRRRLGPQEVTIVHGQPVLSASSPPADCLRADPPAPGKPWILAPNKCCSLSVTVYPHTAGLSIMADGHMRAQHLSEGQAYHVGQGLDEYGQFFPSFLLSPNTMVLFNDGGTHFWLAYPPAGGPALDSSASTVRVGDVEVPIVRMDFVP